MYVYDRILISCVLIFILVALRMRYIAAYLLLQIGGNASPSAADIKKVLGAVGIDTEEDRLSKLLSELEGKDIGELIAEGSAKFASVRKALLQYGIQTRETNAIISRDSRFHLVVLLLPRLVVPRLRLLAALLKLRRRRRRRKKRRFVV